MSEHPRQPIEIDAHGVARFKRNNIVRTLLDVATMKGHLDMNTIAVLPFSPEDRIQFAQLIGYSVSGAGDLGYMPEDFIAQCDAEVMKMTGQPAGRHPGRKGK